MITATALTLNGHDLLTHSRVQTFKTCRRKHFFAYELGIRRKQTAKPLRMGATIHLGIELRFDGATEADAINKATADYNVHPEWITSQEDADEWDIEGEIVRRLLSGYFWRWSNDGLTRLATEQRFDFDIINPESGSSTNIFAYGGKIDGVVKLPDGRTAVLEVKTASDDLGPESDYWARLRIDHQISGYMLGAQALGHTIDTVLYDVIRKPSIRPRKLTKAELASAVANLTWFGEHVHLDPKALPERETVAMFGARLTADIGERPDFYFARMEIGRLSSDLDDFRAELWQTQKDIREAQRTGRWYRNSAACLNYGRCQYADLCFNQIDPRDGIPGGFEQVDEVHPELSGANE